MHGVQKSMGLMELLRLFLHCWRRILSTYLVKKMKQLGEKTNQFGAFTLAKKLSNDVDAFVVSARTSKKENIKEHAVGRERTLSEISPVTRVISV